MQMTNTEIARRYRNAEVQSSQVQILAELNSCDEEQIIEILKGEGIDIEPEPKKRGRKPRTKAEPTEKAQQSEKEPKKCEVTPEEKEISAALKNMPKTKETGAAVHEEPEKAKKKRTTTSKRTKSSSPQTNEEKESEAAVYEQMPNKELMNAMITVACRAAAACKQTLKKESGAAVQEGSAETPKAVREAVMCYMIYAQEQIDKWTGELKEMQEFISRCK